MSKQLSDHERDEIIHKAGISWKYRNEVEEALKGTLYPESLRKDFLELEEDHKITASQRHAIQEAVFGKEK